jgi:uncharacterized 2Fe-2S/4Fe-4S cluster protein (DUF4445 family)
MSDSHSSNCRVVFVPSGLRGEVQRGAFLLEVAAQLGAELESICGGRQTCGKCQIAIEEGDFAKHALQSRSTHVSPIEGRERDYWERRARNGRRLACATQVLGDLLVHVPEESQARKQIIAKTATDCVIDVRPAVRQVYVECEEARLDDPRGDWERLSEALAGQWSLRGLTIDTLALRTLQSALREGRRAVTVSLWQDKEVLRVQPGYAEGVYGLAIDVGSTTVVAHLSDLRTGKLLATEAMMNPQVRYGEDLMSRVSFGMMNPDGVQRMHEAIVDALNRLAEQAAGSAGISPKSILDLVLVGNSVMHHLFLGIDPVELGGAPFALAVSGALDVKARDLGLTSVGASARVHVLPCIAGQNGADNMAVLLAQAPHLQDKMTLVIDIGTNAEILLGNRQQVLAASSPTGPAFEGAQIKHGQRAAVGAIERVRIEPGTLDVRFKLIGSDEWIEPSMPSQATGICGSGIIEAVAEMFLARIVDRDGRFQDAAAERSARVRFQDRSAEFVLADAHQTGNGHPIVVTQNDVRAIQLAKAALYTGVKLLMERGGVSKVDQIFLAGAFGSYISPWHAMVLGLIPDCDVSSVIAAGNAAGDGARIALLNRERRAEAVRLAGSVRYVSIAVEPKFQEEFVAAMALPHARDSFSHLSEVLPADKRPASRERRRRRIGQPGEPAVQG